MAASASLAGKTHTLAFSHRLIVVGALLSALIALAVSLALSVGPVQIPPQNVGAVVLAEIGVHTGHFTDSERLVVLQLRLPRICVALLVGSGLAVSGAMMQALFRNPLADPGVIGVSSGGATAAVIAIAVGVNHSFLMALPLVAFGGALATALVVYLIAFVAVGRDSTATLLLGGVAISAFLGAIISLVLTLAPDNDSLREIVYWLAGGLDSRTWQHVWMAAPLMALGLLMAFSVSRGLNTLTLGEEDARSLGTPVGITTTVALLSCALMTGAAVAVSGTIAFVGLVVPHIFRLMFGADNRLLLPACALGGALFLLLADTFARTVIEPSELRVGIVTSFLGAPFFLFLLLSRKARIRTS